MVFRLSHRQGRRGRGSQGLAVVVLAAASLVGLARPAIAAPDSPVQVEIIQGRVASLVLGGENRIPRDHRQPVWTLRLYDSAEQQMIEVDSITGGAAIGVDESTGPDGRRRWRLTAQPGGELLGVVEGWTDVAARHVDFHVAVSQFHEQYVIDELRYPQFPLAPLGAEAADDRLLAPIAHGQLIEAIHEQTPRPAGRRGNLRNAIYRGYYPSKWASLQMAFYFDDRGGLLFMTPDPKRQIKEFVVDRGEAQDLRAGFTHYVAHDDTQRGRLEIDYPARVVWVEGAWYDAAQVYRQWAFDQQWAQVPLPERPDVPAWFPGNPSWVRIPKDGGPWELRTSLPLIWAKAVGTPMAIHWYGWGEVDDVVDENPYTPPPAASFEQVVRDYHEAGLYVMPYTNVRLVEIGGPFWEKYQDVVVRDRDGEPALLESWATTATEEQARQARAAGDKVQRGRSVHDGSSVWRVFDDFAVGNMGTPQWQQSIIETTLPLVTRHGMDAVYHDQQGNWPALSYDPDHPHAPGDPTAWQAGLEALYPQIHRLLAEGDQQAVLVSEYLSESLIPLLHGGLTVNASMLMEHRSVPLFTTVYHEHFAPIGWAYNAAELRRDPDLYLLRLMMPFVFGAQMGRISPGYEVVELVEKHPSLVACYREAVDLRRQYPQMLGYGKLLRQPVVQDVPWIEVPTAELDKRTHAARWPAILASLFSDNRDQPTGLAVFVNWTSKPQVGQVTLDISELGTTVAARAVDGTPLGVHEGPQLVLPLDLEAHAMQAVLIEPAP